VLLVGLVVSRYWLGVVGAFALALLVSAWPPWERSWPTPAVVWQALSKGAAASKAASVAARRRVFIVISWLRQIDDKNVGRCCVYFNRNRIMLPLVQVSTIFPVC
jgi:hypothetical protein